MRTSPTPNTNEPVNDKIAVIFQKGREPVVIDGVDQIEKGYRSNDVYVFRIVGCLRETAAIISDCESIFLCDSATIDTIKEEIKKGVEK